MIKVVSFLFTFLLAFVFATGVSAEPPEGVPEKTGDYPDPVRKDLRVRVFVHDEYGRTDHPGKPVPVPTSAPALICTDDPNSSAFVSGGLHLPATNWTYKLNTSSVPSSVGPSNLGTIATSGFGQWTSAIGSSSTKPNLVYDGATSISRSAFDGQHVITWGRTSGTALGVTYLWYYPSTGEIAETDTIMNTKFKWAWSGGAMCAVSDAYDAQNILTHEIGHWFGMDDEYDSLYVNNTMFGSGAKGEVKKDTLTSGDTDGVKALYP